MFENYFYGRIDVFGMFMTNIASTAAALVCVCLLSIFRNVEFKVLNWIGKISFYIYLVEAPLIYRGGYVCKKIFNGIPFIIFIIIISAVFIAAFVLGKIWNILNKQLQKPITHQ